MTEQPDWVRAYLLLGKDAGGDLVPILLDADGQMYALLRGADGTGTARTVRVNSSGELYALLKGASGVDVAVDASGYLTTVLKGIDGTSTLRTLLVDASGQAIMVPRGQSGNYLDVDASGFLTAILKGTYGGDLHTIAVDVNGRIEAFMLDAEDQWGSTLRIGNAELAARIGSPKTWDWRGSMFWATDFSNGLGNMIPTLSGTGAAIALSPEYWYSGGYSLKMTGGSTSPFLARAQFYIDHPPSAKCGLEIVFSGLSDYTSIAARFSWYTGNKVYHAEIQKISGGLNTMKYLNSSGTYTIMGNNFEGVNTEMFNHMKIVADLTTFKYIRALWGDTEYDLAGVDVYQFGAGYLNQIIVQIDVVSRSGYNDSKYIDSVLFTVNEP